MRRITGEHDQATTGQRGVRPMTHDEKVKEHQRRIVDACIAAAHAEREKVPGSPLGSLLVGPRDALAKEIAELRVQTNGAVVPPVPAAEHGHLSQTIRFKDGERMAELRWPKDIRAEEIEELFEGLGAFKNFLLFQAGARKQETTGTPSTKEGAS
jgi:hypothetical protein